MSIKTDRPNNIWLTCPYCAWRFATAINPCKGETAPQMVRCPSDDGGCDKDFAVKVILTPTIQVYRLELAEPKAWTPEAETTEFSYELR